MAVILSFPQYVLKSNVINVSQHHTKVKKIIFDQAILITIYLICKFHTVECRYNAVEYILLSQIRCTGSSRKSTNLWTGELWGAFCKDLEES